MMKLVCLAVLLIVISGDARFIAYRRKNDKAAIVGGNYSYISEAPYQAIVYQYGYLVCGAAIISEKWLLSAAHCFSKTNGKYTGYEIGTGSTMRYTGGQRHKIAGYFPHKNYNEKTNDNDIILIKLKDPIQFSKSQKAIKLASEPPKSGDKMKISGFGRESGTRLGLPLLKVAYVPVVNHRICQWKYINDPITDNVFCAGRGEHDSCQGDSGGPGVINEELAGIVSSGMECGSYYYPGIYTKVYKYKEWINKTMAANDKR